MDSNSTPNGWDLFFFGSAAAVSQYLNFIELKMNPKERMIRKEAAAACNFTEWLLPVTQSTQRDQRRGKEGRGR